MLKELEGTEDADAVFASIFRTIENKNISVEYGQLSTKLGKTKEENARLLQLHQRLAEIKGVGAARKANPP